jgi:putative ABC transport system permease protein
MIRYRFLRDVRLGVKNLLLHKMRSLLTTLGVVFGVASVIAMLSVGEGASRQALEQIRKLGSNNIILSSYKSEEVEKTSPGTHSHMSIYGLLYEDERRVLESVPHVVKTVPVRQMKKTAGLGSRTTELRVVATTEQWFQLVLRPLLAGRTLVRADVEQRANVCVLTEFGARKLLAAESAVGNKIRLGREYFEVVGIVRSEIGSASVQIPDEEIDIYIPIATDLERYGEIVAERTSGSRSMELVELHRLLVQIDDVTHVEAAASAIDTLLRRFHPLGDYKVSVPLTLLRQAEATKRTFNIVLGSIAGISLLVGGIGIMNIMLASVTERTREIGIRRAIGARRRQIVVQFLIETVVLSGMGGLIGIMLGIAIPWAITTLSKMPTVVEPFSVILSLVISMTVGVVFGLYPAIRAARLDPIDALRHE